MAAELPRPGVEVIQVFKSVSPTVITPTLVPCVVGVCKQIVDVLTTTSSGGSALNSSALVPFQASFIAKAATGSPPKYAGLDGLSLVLSINNGPPITITFAGALLTPSQVVSQVRTALGNAGVTTATAEIIGLIATATQWRLRTFAANEFQTIEILTGSSNSVLSTFGLAVGRIYSGASYYSQDEVPVNTAAFPDPNNNLSQVSIDPASVRAFLYLGTGTQLLELKKDRSFLENGIATPAVLTGSVDLTGLTYGSGGDLDTLLLHFQINGGAVLTVTFAAPANVGAALSQINAVISPLATATQVTGSNFLRITTVALGPDATIQVNAGTANTVIGLTTTTVTGATAVQSLDQGNGTAVTPLIKLIGANLIASATAAVVTGTTTPTTVTDGETITIDDGTGPQTLIFNSAGTNTAIITQLNGLFGTAAGGRLTASLSTGHVRLTHSLLGTESIIRIVGGTALTALGLTAGVTRGVPFPAAAGDDLYVSGQFFATITAVNVGGQSDTVKIDRQVAINDNIGLSWYIVSKNITPALVQSTKPTPDLVVDGLGNIVVKADILRDTTGAAIAPQNARAQLYLSYAGVREDVTAKATNPGLLRFSNTDDLGNRLAPISAANPLALGLYFALLNAPGTQVTGLGVDAVSANAPYGTVEAFNRAATYLEAFEVYGIAPLTHDLSVGQVFSTHASVMSLPANKGERIALFNPSQPVNAPDTLVGSGLSGNSLPSSDTFDSGVPNLDALLLANGVTGTSALLVSQGVYLDVGDGLKYSISSIIGSQVTVKTSGFLPGDNDDSFYATSTLPGSLIAAPFAVRLRGASLTLTDGTPDKDGIALAYQGIAQGFRNRRLWQIIPDKCAATLGGLEQLIEGFYMLAAVVGMIGQQPPQQSFTNFPMSGFTRVVGSNGFLTEKQLNIAAAGGNYIIVQDDPGAPLISRMALTTDMTSIETRTDSITKVVDFSAKFLRRGLKNFIGRFNITQGFLDSLGHVIQGLLGFLADAGVLIGSHLNNIVQDADSPDTVIVDVTLDVPFPCNYIRLTLVV
jgi:hypothetical protein